MATNKFFTWTKGDKKHAEALRSNGMVPIPVECISIKGLDYGRAGKGQSRSSRRPLPFALDQSPETKSTRNSRTTESFALQDAAVQSATNLMAVMNDMLRSPQMSNYLSSQSSSSRTIRGRPRSYTAPPTPLVEAPLRELAELSGTSPIHPGTHSHTLLSAYNVMTHSSGSTPNHALLGHSIERPRSSPQESTHPFFAHARRSGELSRNTSSLQQPLDPVPRSKTTSPYPQHSAFQDVFATSEETLIGASNTVPSSVLLPPRPTATVRALQPHQSGPHHTLTPPHFGPPTVNAMEHQPVPDSQAKFMDQITALRHTHEAHLQSLKQAHERELDSHRAYIAFLEQHQSGGITPRQPSRQLLTIDTSQAAGRGCGLLSSEESATTSQHSFDSSLDIRPRASSDAIAETEALKRKLSLCRKAQADFGDIRRERDTLRDASDNDQRRIAQLKEIVRKAKDNDKVLRNAIADLESRLTSANDQRIDVLEGYREACEKLKGASDREQNLLRTVKQLDVRFSKIDDTRVEAGDQTSSSGQSEARLNEIHYQTRQELEDIKHHIIDKDICIGGLQEQIAEHATNAAAQATSLRSALTINSQLERELENSKQKLQVAETDRDKFNTLLHSELRRQSRNAAKKALSLTPQIASDAATMTIERIASAKVRGATLKDRSPSQVPRHTEQILEEEMRHCMQEILMYKLDIRGYKKDIKRVNAEIDRLRGVQIERPPTSDGESASSADRSCKFPATHNGDSGLGISMPVQQQGAQTKSKSPAPAAADPQLAIPSTPPPAQQIQISTPVSRPRTPLGPHKKLPKPPSRPVSPFLIAPRPAVTELQRAETLRSLSESIISSYAKRSTIGVESIAPSSPTTTTVPLRGRSSDPPKPKVASIRLVEIVKPVGEQNPAKKSSKITNERDEFITA